MALLRLPLEEPVFLIDVGEPLGNRLMRLAALHNPPTEIDDYERGSGDEDKPSDD